jgi:hypothetical protein
VVNTERTRKVRSDKRVHVNPALPQFLNEMLEDLSHSCGIKKTNMALHMIELCLTHPDIVNHIQDTFKVPSKSHKRLVPIKKDGTWTLHPKI